MHYLVATTQMEMGMDSRLEAAKQEFDTPYRNALLGKIERQDSMPIILQVEIIGSTTPPT